MDGRKKKPKRLKRKLLDKYRLVILNEDTFEERISLKLTRLNVFVVVSLSAILLVLATLMIIAFSPFRENIPGYSSTKLKKQATELTFRTDSLQQVIIMNESYYESIKKVLQGEVSKVDFNKQSIKKDVKLYTSEVD